MFRSNPALGVGFQNFTEYNELTAHNSFVLCFAELGTVGYFFWLGLLIVAIKQLGQVRQCEDDDVGESLLHRQATVLTASFAGMLAAAFFLSRSYTPILYLMIGFAFALHQIARQEGHSLALPSLYRVSRRIIGLELASIAAIYVLVRVNRLFAS